MLFINKLFNSIACLLYFINLQLVIPGRTWILLYLGRTVYKRLWACLALYLDNFTGIKMKRNPNEKSNGKTFNDEGDNDVSHHSDSSTDELDEQ